MGTPQKIGRRRKLKAAEELIVPPVKMTSSALGSSVSVNG